MLRIEVSVAESDRWNYNKPKFERLIRQSILREVADLAEELNVSILSVKFVKPKKPRSSNSTSA